MADFRTLKHVVNENGKSEEKQLENNERTLQGIKGRKVSLYYAFDNLIHWWCKIIAIAPRLDN